MKKKTLELVYRLSILFRDKKFWAALFFVAGALGSAFGHNILPAELQAILTGKIVYVMGVIMSGVGMVLAAYGSIPFEKKDNAYKGGEKK